MRRISYRPYLLLILFFFCLMSLPLPMTERLRSYAVCSFVPGWHGLSILKEKNLYIAAMSFTNPTHFSQTNAELERLSQENQLLRSQIENVREWLLYEDRIQEQVERYKSLAQTADADSIWKEFFKRRSQELCSALDMQIQSIPAKVVFREPAFWSSTLWINRGENDNKRMGKQVIGKNSPVLIGTSIVGIVEFVGANQSKVRLITDSRLTPSVRAVRGKEQNRFLLEHLDTVMFSLELREDLFFSKEEAFALMATLNRLRTSLMQRAGNLFLAKGEIHGTSSPLWRARNQVLKGVGFNYDFSDIEGPARDLRSGEPFDFSRKGEFLPLLRPGDLLVTTGLDGIFPAGFRVAVVSSVNLLKEGASSYEIEAVSSAGNLDELTHVFVLAPYESRDFAF